MVWYKESKNNNIKKNEIEYYIKNTLKNHSFFQSLMSYYGLPIEDIDNNLRIKIKKLDGKYAQGDGEEIHLNEEIFKENGINEESLKNNFHFIVHEFFHWIKRRSEDQFYFNDPEEIQSFIMAITWELIRGKNENFIFDLFYPIVKKYFTNENKAEKVFKKMLVQAHDLKNIFLSKNERI